MCFTLTQSTCTRPCSVPTPRSPQPGQHRHKPKCYKARSGGGVGKGLGGEQGNLTYLLHENSLIMLMMMELQPV